MLILDINKLIFLNYKSKILIKFGFLKTIEKNNIDESKFFN
jgi:hypothetical protein